MQSVLTVDSFQKTVRKAVCLFHHFKALKLLSAMQNIPIICVQICTISIVFKADGTYVLWVDNTGLSALQRER